MLTGAMLARVIGNFYEPKSGGVNRFARHQR